MTEREMIIKALECCAHIAHMCRDCPMTEYRRRYNAGEGCDCHSILADKALKMLMEKESRVMTLEEVRDSLKTPIWKEVKSRQKDLYQGWVLAYDVQTGMGITGTRLGMSEPSGRVVWYKLEDYGRTWRCWTARPMEVQREAMAWES